MEVIRKVRTGLSRDYSLIWILVAVLLLVLSARLAWRIESNTAYFRVNPIFTKGKQHVFLMSFSLSYYTLCIRQHYVFGGMR